MCNLSNIIFKELCIIFSEDFDINLSQKEFTSIKNFVIMYIPKTINESIEKILLIDIIESYM